MSDERGPDFIPEFEIINPSDEAYIKGDFKTCCLATILFGDGKYALKEVGGNREMPLFLLGGEEKWLTEQFGKPVDELMDDVGREAIAEALLSVRLARKRTSLNNFVSYANRLGKRIMDDVKKSRKPAGGA